MSYSNWSLFDLKTEQDNYTQEDVDKVSKLFDEKISKTDYPDWFIEEIFMEGFDLIDGKIRVGGESENIKHDWGKEFGICMGLLVDSFRECNYKLEVPELDECPQWESDNGPGENYVTRFQLSLQPISSMESDWKEGDDDYEAVYIDEEGELEDGDAWDDYEDDDE